MTETCSHLIKDCCKGKRSAQMTLYNLYARKLFIACYRITGNTSEAEEAMQDTFLKIFNTLDQYDKLQSFEAWIHKIAIHTAIDYVRKQHPVLLELSENVVGCMDEVDHGDEDQPEYTVEQIKNATNKLAPGYRVILSLYLFEGYDMEEISTILDIQPASVRSQYLRAKRKLLEIITKR